MTKTTTIVSNNWNPTIASNNSNKWQNRRIKQSKPKTHPRCLLQASNMRIKIKVSNQSTNSDLTYNWNQTYKLRFENSQIWIEMWGREGLAALCKQEICWQRVVNGESAMRCKWQVGGGVSWVWAVEWRKIEGRRRQLASRPQTRKGTGFKNKNNKKKLGKNMERRRFEPATSSTPKQGTDRWAIADFKFIFNKYNTYT